MSWTSFHVSVDTVHQSLLRCSSYPRWYHLQCLSSEVVLVSTLRMSKPHQLAFLHISVTCSTFSHSPMSSFLTWSLIVWSHAHLCIFSSSHLSLPVSSRERVSNIIYNPVQNSWLNNHIVNLCVVVSSSRIDPLSYSSSCSIHTVSSCSLLYSCLHRSAGRHYVQGIFLFFLLFPLCRGEAGLLVTAKYGCFRD